MRRIYSIKSKLNESCMDELFFTDLHRAKCRAALMLQAWVNMCTGELDDHLALQRSFSMIDSWDGITEIHVGHQQVRIMKGLVLWQRMMDLSSAEVHEDVTFRGVQEPSEMVPSMDESHYGQ